ncbi:Sensor histidine kinase BtsS [bioreactor metagenome]|uniref:Sensor histidine kinase BtsS n=1 Tax=bioreactor metagenome TaxID=1076179 RepID=A0A644T310_9ZZZZ|nr:LytS/YhcK type 5TM receptor domain-containing protein [Negativicutes bacterium]
MQDSLSVILFQRIAIIAVVAYVFSQTQAFRSLFKNETTLKEKIVLVFFFTTVSIAGTYFGIPIEDALANVRDTGTIVAGLLGGPLVGGLTGIISGLHRMTLGGFTAIECGIATIIGGVLAGYLSVKMKPKTPEVITGVVTGVSVVLFSMALILIFAKPYPVAASLVNQVALPMSLANAIGIAVFMIIIHNAREHQTKIGALQTNKALRIANATLPHWRKGLNINSAEKVAATIQTMTSASAVAITDCEKILAHVGMGSDHHIRGALLTETISHCLHTGQIAIVPIAKDLCPHNTCPLKSAITVQLQCRDEKVGTLTIYYPSEAAITELDIEFAQGLGQIFSTQLELANLQQMAELATKAELKALRAQINPHFLFNSLNTIVSLCRTNSEEARNLIIELSDFFRRSLKSARDFVTIQEELELVDSYLTLEKARFGHRLSVEKDIETGALDVQIPIFTLQPLVENAVKHGLLTQEQGGTVTISIKKDQQHVAICISDNGLGIIPELLSKIMTHGFGKGAGVGLSNVNDRLKVIYGPQYALAIDSVPGFGTNVRFSIPIRMSEGVVT